MTFIQTIDSNILFWIQNNLHNKFLDYFMSIITTLGDMGIIWILIAFALLFSKKYRTIGILTLSALLLNLILGEGILKNLIQRPRPFVTLEGLDIIITKPSSYSFPSGHTSSAFAAALMLGYYFKKYRWYLYIFAGLTAFSRIYLLVHYPSDILGGIMLGAISCFTVRFCYERYLGKKKNNIFSK